MKFVRKICIFSDGSLIFYRELQTLNNEITQFFLEDAKNFFLNNKNSTRQFNSKFSLKQKKKYFKKK